MARATLSERDIFEQESLYAHMNLIKTRWELTDEQLANALGESVKTIRRWFKAGRVPNHQSSSLKIISEFFGLAEEVNSLFSNQRTGEVEWLKTTHPLLGKTPLAFMSENVAGIHNLRCFVGQLP